MAVIKNPKPRQSPLSPSLDHVLPRSYNGSDDLSNLQLAHAFCNNKRGNLLIDEIPEDHFIGLPHAIQRFYDRSAQKTNKRRRRSKKKS